MSFFVHPRGLCESTSVGEGTRVGAFSHVLPGAAIGRDCEIGDHVFIESDVIVGDRVTVKCGVQLWDGLRVQGDAFIGPNVTFTNDSFPPRRGSRPRPLQTVVEHHGAIGANAVILPGIRIGAHAIVGAGSVVTHDVPPHAIVAGNPARIIGYAQTTSQPVTTATAMADDAAGVRELGVPGVLLYCSPAFEDLRGNLTVTDIREGLPFVPRRYFLVNGVSSQRIRGEHAHKECEQFLVCVSGSIHLVVDDGRRREEIVLSRPNLGVYLPSMIWGMQYNFTRDAALLVFASHPYDPSDYIREYQEFLRLVAGRDPASNGRRSGPIAEVGRPR